MAFPARPLALFLLAFLTLPAMAPADTAPDERPRLENYDSQEEFVRDVLAWEKRQREAAGAPSQGSAEPAQEDGEEDHDWHHVTGPEDLDEALRNAYGYEQPNYKEKYRFNRTTHISFPLERLPAGQLSRQVISGGLRGDLEGDDSRSLEPLPELRTALQETASMAEADDRLPSVDESFTVKTLGPRVELANP